MSTQDLIKQERISIHALREESDQIIRIYAKSAFSISIHALREESDWITKSYGDHAKHFYPRSP